jgi:hypothetical protein
MLVSKDPYNTTSLIRARSKAACLIGKAVPQRVANPQRQETFYLGLEKGNREGGLSDIAHQEMHRKARNGGMDVGKIDSVIYLLSHLLILMACNHS